MELGQELNRKVSVNRCGMQREVGEAPRGAVTSERVLCTSLPCQLLLC